MKEFLEKLRSASFLKKIDEPLSTNYDIAAILLALENQALIFSKVKESEVSLAGNLYSSKRLLSLGLGIQPEELEAKTQESMTSPSDSPGKISGFAKSAWDHNERADLGKLPILRHFQKEAGNYITAGIVVAKFPNSDHENLSFHRMLVLGRDKVAVRIVPRHLNQILKESENQRTRVSVVIGPPPAVFLAASLQTQFGLSEYNIANKLLDERLTLQSSELSDLSYPMDSEIVLEGYLEGKELVDEGPFVDLTGTYDGIRSQPTIRFEMMHYRDDSVYQAVVASSAEHSLFMGLPQELKIREALSKSIPRVRGVNLTRAGNGYFHCVVSIDKTNDGDGKTAILNCFAAAHPLKLVIVVDYDVDPFDMQEVEWAIATRFQADKGIAIINGAKGSSLDPSSGKLAITSKLGIDATIPLSSDKTKYAKAVTTLSPEGHKVLERLGNRSKSILQQEE